LTRKKQKTGHLSNCKKIASDRLEKNCTWQAEKTTGAFCAGCPYISLFKILFFLQTSFPSALLLSALLPCQVQKRSSIPDPGSPPKISALH